MKLFSKIATAFVGIAMAIGVGVATESERNNEVYATEDTATYTLVTSTDQLETGKNYVITNGKDNGSVNAMSVEVQEKYRRYTPVTVSNGTFAANANVLRLTLSGSSGSWVFTTDNYAGTNGVLYPASGDSKNELYVGSSSSTATISFSSDAAVITLSGGSRGIIRWNNNSGQERFSCYKSGQSAVYLWKESAAPTTTYTVSFNGNGGTGDMESVPGVLGNYTLPSCGFTAPSGKAFAGWKAANAGDLILAGGSYTVSADVTFFAQWADSYNVTYTAGANGTGSYTHSNQPAGNYTMPAFADLAGINANTGYRFANYTVGGVNKNPGDIITLSGATSVTVNFEVKPEETTYVFATNFSTYASSWNTTYGSKTLQGKTDVGGGYDATITLNRANKQSSGIGSAEPFLASPKSTTTSPILVFELTETGYKIKDVTVTFTQRGSATPTFNLYKGNSCSGTALDSAVIGTSNTLETTSLNDVSFSLDCIATAASNNVGAALTSIYISVEKQSAYGTTDHITVTKFPNLIYHVGEVFDSTGLEVIAYDGADEATANFKNVTDDVDMGWTSGIYTFDESNVPTSAMWLCYLEDDTHYYADDIVFSVYALAEYELVTSEPADWSGNYLIVSTNSSDELVAMNGSLATLDAETNYKSAPEKSTGVIENGQELEFAIAAYSTGYSIQAKNGKYIGWAGGDNNGLTTSDSPLVNTLSYSDGVSIAGSGGRKLMLNTTADRFRYYASGTVQLYKLKQSSHADEYAQTFLGAFTCDASGETAPSFNIKEGETYWSWSLLADEYDTLTAVEKEEFRLGVPSETGDNVAQAIARYDYVVAKYGYSNFMSRTITPLRNSGTPTLGSNSTNTAIIVVSVIAVVSVSSIGVLLVLKRRKNHI